MKEKNGRLNRYHVENQISHVSRSQLLKVATHVHCGSKECRDGREMELSLVNQLLIQLLALLDDVLLLEQLLQREIIRIKQAVDGRCVGKSHTPKHG